MKTLLAIASLALAAAGLALLAYPSIVIRLLFGQELAVAGVMMSRFAGIILIALGVACWPNDNQHQPLYGALTYSVLAMLFLIVLAIGGISGILLWPGIIFHAVISALLIRTRSIEQKPKAKGMMAP